MNKLYRNPTPGTFTLLLIEAEEATPITVEIYSMIGERILQTQLTSQQQYEFDLSNRPGGVYLVRVVRGEEVGVEKVVKQGVVMQGRVRRKHVPMRRMADAVMQ